MAVGPKRLAYAAAVIAIVAACDAPIPVGPAPSDQLVSAAKSGGTTIAGQLIAFASTRDVDFFQTFIMKANGTKVAQLTYQPFYNARSEERRVGKECTIQCRSR